MTTQAQPIDFVDNRMDLLSMTQDELELFISRLGKEKYRAAQIMKWMHRELADSFDPMTNLAKAFREQLSLSAKIGLPAVIGAQRSSDRAVKYLLGLEDGNRIETVLIPGDDHETLCISSQVGCSMACGFCSTGAMGFVRNLSPGEIVSQLLIIRRNEPTSKITNIVFMGMGEPLANLDNVVQAINILSHPNGPGISWRHITVSTAGLVPKIPELGRSVRVKLAVSLNAVTNEQRSRIMPINKAYPIEALIEALRSYPLPKRDRITIEYVLIKDFNDSLADAKKLVRLLNPLRVKINLIPLNDQLSGDLKAPDPEQVALFQDYLMSKALIAIIRKSRGQDILAACGQLAAPQLTSECSC
jgi:23S rRNA (adenine2503-C2)-methyltransferase